MTNEETTRAIDQFLTRRQALSRKVETAARAVVPVLLDAERKNSAAELQQLLFEIDALDQEISNFVEKDPQGALEAIFAKLRK